MGMFSGVAVAVPKQGLREERLGLVKVGMGCSIELLQYKSATQQELNRGGKGG